MDPFVIPVDAEGFAWTLVAFMPEPKRTSMYKRLRGTRRFNLTMQLPGWIDADPPTWKW